MATIAKCSTHSFVRWAGPAVALAVATVAAACSGSDTGVPVPAALATTRTAGGLATTTAAKGSGTGTTGTAAPPAGDAAVTLAQKFAGTYAGTWTNKTYNSTGAVKTTITVDASAKVVTSTTTLTGNVFGAPAPGPITVKLDLAKLTDKATFTTDLFGEVTVTVAPDLTVTLEALKVPGTRVNTFKSTSKLEANGKMSGTYEVGLKDGTKANGVTELTKS